MSRLTVGLSAVALLATGALTTPGASAAPLVPQDGAVKAAIGGGAVQTVDYFYGGRNYCWYYDGWHGPGWYWCGYAWRRGYGWGSPVWGWNGWAWGGPRYGRGWGGHWHGGPGGHGGHGGHWHN
jgi:hypothetical protein